MTATCHRLTVPAYCDLLEEELERFVRAAGTEPNVSVPSCPGWTVRDVVEHVGGLHRWAEAHVRLSSTRRIRAKELELDTPSEPSGWETWLREGIGSLVATLRTSDPDATVWTWGSDKHARFWGRRMLFETNIHRADLELAAGLVPHFDQAVGVDGIDEFLDNLPHAAYFAPRVKELRGVGERISLRASDIDLSWNIGLLPDGFSWQHDGDGADVRVRATASDLLLFVYGRKAPEDGGLEATGQVDVLERWRINSSI